MTTIWYIISIGILALFSTIVTSSKGSLTDNRQKGFQGFTKKAIVIFFTGIAIVLLSLFQYFHVQKEEEKKEKKKINEQRISDSTNSDEIKKGVDSNRKRLFKDLSEALLKQYLKLDTVTKELNNIKDSVKKATRSISPNPFILIRSDGIKYVDKGDTLFLELALVSTVTSAKVYFIDYLCEINYKNGYKQKTGIARLIQGVLIMPTEVPVERQIIITHRANSEINNIVIGFIGHYSSDQSNKIILFKEIYRYRRDLNQTGFLEGDEKELFFKKYNFK